MNFRVIMSPENKSQLRNTIDELKCAVVGCLGDTHASLDVITQIEQTVAAIENKADEVTKLETSKLSKNPSEFTAKAAPLTVST